MKNILLVAILFFLLSPLFSQTFTAMDIGSIGEHLNGIHFVSNNKGVVVGNGGQILITSDGSNWVPRTSGVTADLSDVKYLDSNTIIAVGWGIVIKSTDSGLSWSPIYPGGAYNLLSVYVNGTDLYATGQNGVIIKSIDEGDSWTSVSPGTGAHIFKLCFASPTVGFAVGNDGYIHKTTNGGASWDYDDTPSDFQLRSVYFTDADNGYIVGRSLVANVSIFMRTANGGATWSSEFVYGANYIDIEFLSNEIGFIIGQNEGNVGAIFRTIDGGVSWNFLETTSRSLTDITFSNLNAGVGYICGFNGSIYKSTNIVLDVEILENDDVLSIYPNPTFDKVTILLHPSIKSKYHLLIQVYSISGKKLISTENTDFIDFSEMPAGVYIMNVQNDTNHWTKKIIKN